MSIVDEMLANKHVQILASLMYGGYAGYGGYCLVDTNSLLGKIAAVMFGLIIGVPVFLGMEEWMKPSDKSDGENKLPDVELEVVDP